jgi:hypothetical protein
LPLEASADSPYEVFDLAISWAEMVIVQIEGNWLGIKTQVKRMELEKWP